uniref:Uncharacterized protein n=1 Tax=Rhizophora mucronata TaxID=61149 RepID=A0A2P2JVP2_RHIMU
MDPWVVGAAAAAGYIAKYWKIISKDKDSLSGVSSEACKNEKRENLTCPLHRLAKQKKIVEDASTIVGRKISNGRFSQLGCASEAEVFSKSENNEKLGHLENFENFHVLDLASIQPGFSTKENLNECETRNGVESPSSHFTIEIASSHGWRPRSSLRAKLSYGQVIKPLSSLESCIMAQLYKEHMEMEEYVLRSFPSPFTTMRPLLVTDGSHIISRANTCSFHTHNGPDDDRPDKEDSICGISQLPKLELHKRRQMKTRRLRNERLSSYHKLGRGEHVHSQKGSHDGRVLFCLGLSVGIISSLISNRREVDKLKELLRQTEALVQDLQEELEMKDSLAVRELPSENHESLGTSESSFHNNAPNQPFSVQKGHLTNNCGKESYSEKAEDSSESMSKIEAELEAELERLGLNMNMDSLERELSNLVEVSPFTFLLPPIPGMTIIFTVKGWVHWMIMFLAL